jgi:dihydrofolate synthase/folylpolyglutamate synthase
MNKNSYENTLIYLYEQLPMFHRIGAAAYKANLDNIIALIAALGDVHKKIKCIHIAGTNGKGSTSHMITSILQASGYKTGLYTSPHLIDFRERIRINGQIIDKKFVIDFVEKIKPIMTAIQPSFFEITLAMCFSYFHESKIDVAVIETGLGGRLDSTNIINPILTAITNISLDHTNLLGNTVEEIAMEKAGIIKPFVPIILGDMSHLNKIFAEISTVKQSPIIFSNEHYSAKPSDIIGQTQQFILNDKNNHKSVYSIDLMGHYQQFNLPIVMCMVDQLRLQGFTINESAVKNGLENTKAKTGLRGRWEVLQQTPLVIADIAHNTAGVKHVIDQLNSIKNNFDKCYIVFGMVADKDVETVLKLLPKYATYYFCKPDLPRALDQNELLIKANNQNLIGSIYTSVANACNKALQCATTNDIILITGSNFVVAEAITFLDSNIN